MVHDIIIRALSEGRFKLLDHEAYELLEAYGIPTPGYRVVSNYEEAIKAANEVGYPVAIKVVSPDIMHKTDVGGVVLNINNDDDVKRACGEINNNIKHLAPYARVFGFLVQHMVQGGLEVIIGGLRDRIFGTVILFGIGGILTELYKDTSMRIAPITEDDALSMIKETKAYQLMIGYRSMPRRDIYSLVDIIVKFSRLMTENPQISEADLNPVIMLESGKGSYAVDARFIIKPT
ncbi:acetate--CoA ligase family protein [Caldivirga sp. UBA161]|uniref:acetate--CoA ligase family protein n=1 Tax=Caldivirga sp. UBA161 TaxID=1915569 RepID=UPI0025BA1806|nr:acetate--CoA ligase family protein [Caldivirga sp. UBA161]